MVNRQSLPVFADQPGHLLGHGADINSGRAHAENCRDQLLVSQGGCAALPQSLTGAAVLWQVLDGSHRIEKCRDSGFPPAVIAESRRFVGIPIGIPGRLVF